ncbi:MAG: hypothetical protein COV37_02020 [Bdellovibrio sp. CG11_big_fil_rev_8_21_14_0_20_39_38]|nr:MAG: hypothetical protein COW78_09795 [Bdellovibrio sp. CG22_combo_CG10-13_8_21_14_all_39_27]PIR36619.1 MAG: hypothetical protein COV37_02020 [Bdellovibrio sp. CG11_big_fil_rev_8_21_14_0_20_39_38]
MMLLARRQSRRLMDWNIIRQQFPITQNQTYLMNAAVSGMHERTLKVANEMLMKIAMKGAIADEDYFNLIVSSKDIAAQFVNAGPAEVVFTSNTSHNMNLLAMMLKDSGSKRKILVPDDEFPSSVIPWHHHGFEVIKIQSQKHVYSAYQFEEHITDDVAAIVISGIQYGTGFKMPIKEIVYIANKYSVPVILNATQQLGQSSVDLKELGVAAMSCSCHKWLGAGIGMALLYVNENFSKDKKWPFAGWVSVEEPWTLSIDKPQVRRDAGVLGTGSAPFINMAAIQEAMKVQMEIGKDRIEQRICELSQKLYQELTTLNYKVFTPRESKTFYSGIISFAHPEKEAIEIASLLKEQKVFINHRKGRMRASIHFYNNEDDIQALISGLRSL